MKVTRRTFLRQAGLTAAAGWVLGHGSGHGAWAQTSAGWDDPTAWPLGQVPGPGDVAEVRRAIILDHDVEVAGVRIEEGGTLTLEPSKVVTLETSGNVEVLDGTLVMRPDPAVVHTLRFVNVDEGTFVGGGLDPVPQDIGLWVMEDGSVELVGTEKVAWDRTGDDPSWNDADELILTPTAREDFEGFLEVGRGALVPEVGQRWPAEVLNLTRNVRIEGTVSGRAHIFIRSHQPQTIAHAVLRYLGPAGVLGRYPLHFHHSHDGSRGSVVEGVVARNSGNHAFVPHMSHGITFRDCIAYDTLETAFWWDNFDISDDVVWERCVAALVRDEATRSVAGFLLGRGTGNVVRDSVAVGVLGGDDASGFWWPSQANQPPNVWVFEDNIAHNNKRHGIFVWQNSPSSGHFVDRFVAYRCGRSGIKHGAYGNRGYHYRDVTLFENGEQGIGHHAQTTSNLVRKYGTERLSFERVAVVGGSVAVHHGSHQADAGIPTIWRGCTFTGQSKVKVLVDERELNPGLYDYVRCGVEPEDIDIVKMLPGARIRVQREDGTAFQVDSTGAITPIEPFDLVFWDVPDHHWAYDVVAAVAAAGIAKGYPDGTYRPENDVTRGEMAAFLSRAVGLEVKEPDQKTFTDVAAGHWAFEVIEAVAAAGIAQGYPDGTFRPDQPVTRAEMAAFLVRALREEVGDAYSGFFPDVTQGQWFTSSVERLAEVGIIKGYPDGTFRPDNNVTRAETAAFLQRSWKYPIPA